jgi:hypothetical protein
METVLGMAEDVIAEYTKAFVLEEGNRAQQETDL